MRGSSVVIPQEEERDGERMIGRGGREAWATYGTEIVLGEGGGGRGSPPCTFDHCVARVCERGVG
jgi:hypothetical protein